MIGSTAVNDKIALWVRDITQDGFQVDMMTLITIYSRTGFIAAHPLDISTVNASTTSIVPLSVWLLTHPGNVPPQTLTLATPLLPGAYTVVLGSDGPYPETQLVTVTGTPGTPSNTVTLGQVTYAHTVSAANPTFAIILNPFSFISDGRSSGL